MNPVESQCLKAARMMMVLRRFFRPQTLKHASEHDNIAISATLGYFRIAKSTILSLFFLIEEMPKKGPEHGTVQILKKTP